MENVLSLDEAIKSLVRSQVVLSDSTTRRISATGSPMDMLIRPAISKSHFEMIIICRAREILTLVCEKRTERWGVFCHSPKLEGRPARFDQV